MDIVAEDFTIFDLLLNVELEDVVTDVGLTEEVNLNVVDKPKDMVICLLHLALFFFQMLFDFIVEQGKLIQKFLAILVVHKVVDWKVRIKVELHTNKIKSVKVVKLMVFQRW